VTECRVRFLPDGAEGQVPAGSTILAVAAAAHLPIDAPCGDRGTCGKCRIQIVSLDSAPDDAGADIGPAPTAGKEWDRSTRSTVPGPQAHPVQPPTLPERTLLSPDELAQGWRLACQAVLAGSLTVMVPDRSLRPAVVPISEIEPMPFVRRLAVTVPEPTLEDPAPDLTRLRRAIGAETADVEISFALLRRLPFLLDSSSTHLSAVLAGSQILSLEAATADLGVYGVAVDLGTTSVVVALADLSAGRVLGIESRLNGQVNFGADVISRILHASTEPAGLDRLREAAVVSIDSALDSLLRAHGVARDQVYEVLVAGNSCMNHLLLGIDPRSLAAAPYQPVLAEPVTVRASEVGLRIHPEGLLYAMPNVAGFVGSDTIAVILATGMHQSQSVRLALDLGTNGEVVLGNRDRLLACSTAAGPAFEGARISRGMRATEGAIERVWIDGESVKLQVIGDRAPVGLCGSGLLDAVAQMREVGVLSQSGRMATPETAASQLHASLARRLVREDGSVGFSLARRGRRSLLLTQGDVRELQLAKGAIRAGISILLDEYGIGHEDLEEVLLAGAFGSYINPSSALSIGLVPPVPRDRIAAVGNAAGQGAVMALLSTRFREEAAGIARSVEYVELSARPDFMDQFMEAMSLGA
jgi:uncharacterized 2Fe-2S/4Fe-4S cluster protein (DUF4445 family)